MALYRPPTQFVNMNYEDMAKTAVIPATTGKTIHIVGATVNNRSGGAAFLGLGWQYHTSMWKAGLWDDSETASYVDDTTDAQDAGASDFALCTANVNNDGFVVQCKNIFNMVILDVATAEVGSPTYEYTYWNGSSWNTLNTFTDLTGTDYDIGEHVIPFATPQDWAKLASGDTPVDDDTLTTGYYAIRMRATTAPTTAPLATKIYVAKMYDYMEAIADNSVLNCIPEDPDEGIAVPGGASVIPYFSTAGVNNSVSVRFFLRG